MWLGAILLFLFIPLLIWGLAFLIWFNWLDITGFFHSDRPAAAVKPAKQIDKPRREKATPPQEKILDEDRKNLEQIIKRREY
jgi:hypothetical protein